jgi:hypothetical protein
VSARIRRVGTDAIITTYAGAGFVGYSGDGDLATKARINSGGRLALDSQNNLYLTDPVSNVIRSITPDGAISTYTDNGKAIHAGDDIPATQAALNIGDGQIACDAAGNLYIAETGNSQIMEVSTSGVITTVAGTGETGFQNGPALSALFNQPLGLTSDPSRVLYVGDQNNGVVRMISGGMVTTFAGTHAGFGFAGVRRTRQSRHRRRRQLSHPKRLARRRHQYNRRQVPIPKNTPDGAPALSSHLFGPQQISFDSEGTC